MFNARIKIILITSALVLTSCGPSETEKKHAAAEELAAQIETFLNEKNYVGAIALIDSLNSAYPDEVELRKTTLLSRARAMEGMVLDSIPVYDAIMARVTLEKDSLDTFFVNVSVPGLDDYRVDRSVVDASFTSHTAAQPRLGDEQIPWTLAVNITGKTLHIFGLRLAADGKTVSEVTADNATERRIIGSGGEMFSFGPEDAWQISDALAGVSANAKLVLVVMGEKGDVDIAVNDRLRSAIERTARRAQLIREDHDARLSRELLERKLIIARDQIANFNEN